MGVFLHSNILDLAALIHNAKREYVPYNLECSTFLHYFMNFFTTLLSSSVCYFTFQVRFNPQFKQLFA